MLLEALSELVSNSDKIAKTQRTKSSEITATEIENLLTDFMKTTVEM